MTQFDGNLTDVPATGSPSSNVYTVLALIATILLAVGVAFVALKNIELTGEGIPRTESSPAIEGGGNNPFFILERPDSAN